MGEVGGGRRFVVVYAAAEEGERTDYCADLADAEQGYNEEDCACSVGAFVVGARE